VDITLRIRRFNPETDVRSHWEEYTIDMAPRDRVLDALMYIKNYLDGTLTLRKSCAMGICGSDAMRINGKNRLACKTLIQTVTSPITIEPLYGLPVIKDLVVDMEPFFEHYRSIIPFLINDEPPPEKERLQSPAQRERYDDTTKCILCAACTTACPPFWSNGKKYVGPAAIVQAHRFIFDSRDKATQERLNLMSQPEGVWRCRTVYNCTEACPRDIHITEAIGEVKRAISLGMPEVEEHKQDDGDKS
jgi:succinate dehydrogenase / fumarate reductase, iron-sulfur subunit